ncbi:hypothetical protein B0J11DRAFT_497843 [Dendryphion nanum]|uniref:DUF7728 domain-containing protein n=1 Tax=Dendryphion nanum TaxID=256645 RepID=A0A9P9I9L5_9PLEO|nr:hypothetical protein B0J11DRAFT_497843 [Dendryphion nanum]
MLPGTLGVYASLALAVNAVLLPPNVTPDSLGDGNPLETLAISPLKRTIAIDCPGCASASVKDGVLSWTQDAGNSFLLEFEVGSHEDTLDIDGVQLYPPAFGHGAEPFYITQVDPRKESSEPLRLRVTGFTFRWSSAQTISEGGTELLPMTFRITSIESMPFGLPALKINILKDVEGRLMIASFDTAKAEEASPIDQDKDCKEWPLLCKWKSILADKVDSMKKHMGKGCHRHKTGRPVKQDDKLHEYRPGHPHPHHRPHHHAHGHGHGHHRHSHHRVHMFLRRAFFTIVIPILIGIFAGTLTYLIGMALGCLIAVVVTKIRGYGPYESIPQDDDNNDNDNDNEDVERADKKEVYSDLPEYDAPPVYEVAAEKEVVSETN